MSTVAAGTDLPTFEPAWWLPGPHLQAAWATFARPWPQVDLRREVIGTPDGDELVLDHVEGPPGSPRLVILHGLEGSSLAPYVQGLAALARGRGLRVTAVNFRGCALDLADRRTPILNRRPRSYHSGETGDLDLVVRRILEEEPSARVVAAGVSLGGNVLLKWLGEDPARHVIGAATTISAPYDLAAGARSLCEGLGPLYVSRFLASLGPKVTSLVARFPEVAARVDLARALAARDFRTFDDAATGPIHGFAGADDYYARSSSMQFLPHIRVQTLCISARDDPFQTPEALGQAVALAPASVKVMITPTGGHAAFVSGRFLRPRYFAEEAVIGWLARQLDCGVEATLRTPSARSRPNRTRST